MAYQEEEQLNILARKVWPQLVPIEECLWRMPHNFNQKQQYNSLGFQPFRQLAPELALVRQRNSFKKRLTRPRYWN